jgi:hypothetical protein
MTTLLLQSFVSRLIGDPPERPAAVAEEGRADPRDIAVPFDPTPPRAEVEALAVEVKALAASFAELGAELEAGDAELREVEMRMTDLETALDEARDRQLVAFELLSMADIAVSNRLNGPKFLETTDLFGQQGGELAGLTRRVVGVVKRLLVEGSNVGAMEIATALRLEAKRLLDPRSNRSRRHRGKGC